MKEDKKQYGTYIYDKEVWRVKKCQSLPDIPTFEL